MSQPESEPGLWHGWAHNDSAVYVAPTQDDEHIGLYIQQARVTELAGVFVDAAMAQMFMDWMDESLGATGEANAELLRRLQTEQPLLFQPQPPMPETDDDEVDDDGK